MFVAYELLSETARVWIYPASRKFYNEEIELLKTKIQDFITQWKQDDVDFKCSYQLLYNRFIIILGEGEHSLSHKDMDDQVGFILRLQNEYELELLDKMNVSFKQGEYVQYKEVKEFKKLLKNRAVSEKTIVFDHLIQTKSELENYWEVPITESWYNRFL